MNIEQVRTYTLSLPGVTEDMPFGDDVVTFRIEGMDFRITCLFGEPTAQAVASQLPAVDDDPRSVRQY